LCGGVLAAAAGFELTTSRTDIARDSTPRARARRTFQSGSDVFC
jgi:hypothetical protein